MKFDRWSQYSVITSPKDENGGVMIRDEDIWINVVLWLFFLGTMINLWRKRYDKKKRNKDL